MTDPDFSPVTGNRIRPVNDCPCSTCAALRSGEPDTTPKEKPPMAATTTVRFEIVDATAESDILLQLAEALAAVEEWKATVGRWADVRDVALTERDTARAENERLRGELHKAAEELDKSRQECGSRGLRVAALSGERDRERDNANVLRASNAGLQREMNRAIAERDAARTERRACEAECELLRKENCGLRDDVEGAIAERDEARKALADRGGVTLGIYANACRTRDEASAKLAALRARVAELEAELAAARNNPLSLFDGPTQTTGSHTKQIKPGLWFVGLTVNARGSTGASTEAIKRIAGWI